VAPGLSRFKVALERAMEPWNVSDARSTSRDDLLEWLAAALAGDHD
jgi:hypothetical protein